jgi:hypothetical protein
MTSKSKSKSASKANLVPFVSQPLKLDIQKRKNVSRIDLEFWGVDHSGPSYEGRVFINNPKADINTKMIPENGYVGSYYVFGHGQCFGDLGHCDVMENSDPLSPSHPLTPLFKVLTVTEMIKKIGQKTNQFIVTIVPNVASGSMFETKDSFVKLAQMQIVPYD